MNKSVSALCLLLALSGSAIAETAPGSAEVPPAGDPAAGKAKAAVCAACHGVDGNSTNPEWPKLAGQGAPYLFKQLTAFKAGKRQNPIMQGQVATLSEQEMRDLAAYFASQQIQVGAANPEAVTLGERLYRGGNADKGIPACMGCHGPAGAGNPAALYPALGGQHAQYVVNQLKAYAEGQRQQLMMSDIAARMSKKEMEDVASYIQGLY
jgi:cytochrome c553